MADGDKNQSGASDTFPKQCSALRKGEHVMIKGHPCKIVDMSTSKTGKHGHAKVHMVALDIFDGKKYEDICPSTHNMICPHVSRKEYMAMDIDEEGFVEIMLDSGETRQDLKVKEAGTLKEIKEGLEAGSCNVTVLSAKGIEKIIAVKAGKD